MTKMVYLDTKCVGYDFDRPSDPYWNKVVSGPFSSGVVLQFTFLLHYTTSQGECGDPIGCRSFPPGNHNHLPQHRYIKAAFTLLRCKNMVKMHMLFCCLLPPVKKDT